MGCNNFITNQQRMSEHNKKVEEIEKKMVGNDNLKSQEEKKQAIFEYGNYESQFLNLPSSQKEQKSIQRRPNVLTRPQVEKSLQEIYGFYSKSYLRPVQQYSGFDQVTNYTLNFQAFLLFAKHFGILKTIFSLERITTIFKKYANYGKYLSFDNFYFMISSIAHEPEAKKHFNIESVLEKLDIETVEEVEKQEFYHYLSLDNEKDYRLKFNQLFQPFGCTDKPGNSKIQYSYRKFSLPELIKKALPENKKERKEEKDLFVVKNKNVDQNLFDEAKSIVVSWQSLRAKSVNNIKPGEIIEKKFLHHRIDPQDDQYLKEFKKDPKADRKSKIESKIRQMEERQNVKNKQILSRIDKKIQKVHKLKI